MVKASLIIARDQSGPPRILEVDVTSHISILKATTDELIERLRENALAAIARHGNRHVIKYAKASNQENEATQAEIADLRNSAPDALITAMRAPVGTQSVIKFLVRGRQRRVVINALGKPLPDREQEVWRQIRNFARVEAA